MNPYNNKSLSLLRQGVGLISLYPTSPRFTIGGQAPQTPRHGVGFISLYPTSPRVGALVVRPTNTKSRGNFGFGWPAGSTSALVAHTIVVHHQELLKLPSSNNASYISRLEHFHSHIIRWDGAHVCRCYRSPACTQPLRQSTATLHTGLRSSYCLVMPTTEAWCGVVPN